MNITERYAKDLVRYIGGDISAKEKHFPYGSGWIFPCPFCSALVNKKYKKRQPCASFIPNGNYSYIFTCCRKKSSQCKNNMLFPNFLKTYNPKLFNEYHLERERAGSTGKGHDICKYNYFGEKLWTINQHIKNIHLQKRSTRAGKEENITPYLANSYMKFNPTQTNHRKKKSSYSYFTNTKLVSCFFTP